MFKITVYIFSGNAKLSHQDFFVVFPTSSCLCASLTLHTFRLELDKYVQGLHSSLQTPEVQKNTAIMTFMFSSQYECHIYTLVLAAEPRHGGAALSEPMV